MKKIVILAFTVFLASATLTVTCPGPCASGFSCVNGRCSQTVNPISPTHFPRPQCISDAQCGIYARCSGGQCVNVPVQECRRGCLPNQKCVYGQCVTSNDNTCVSDQQCDRNQNCFQGRCVKSPFPGRNCFTSNDCQNGRICINYKCVNRPTPPPPPPPPVCFPACGPNYRCQNGRCVYFNKCLVTTCPINYSCRDGVCYPPSPPVCFPACPANYQCQSGRCVYYDKCLQTPCPLNYLCRDGVCYPPSSSCNPPCSSNSYCQLNRCIPYDRCLSTTCPINYICRDGVCYPPIPNPCSRCLLTETCTATGQCVNKCALINCGINGYCVDGVCYTYGRQCSGDDECNIADACRGGKCVPACSNVFCTADSRCIHGNCRRVCDYGDTANCRGGQVCQRGICVDKCLGISCPIGYQCYNGNCRPVSNPSCGYGSTCPSGSYCSGGRCVPNISVCPANEPYKATTCTNPRPNESTCPTVYYIRAPDPAFCGVRPDGTRVNFARQCQACKDTSISYYFNEPCYDAPAVCGYGEDCRSYYCSKQCSRSEECPYDWQVCNAGRCVDPCEYLRCASCRFGQCAYQAPYGTCAILSTGGCPKPEWSCVGGKCVDLCANKSCPAYHDCKFGDCVPTNFGHY